MLKNTRPNQGLVIWAYLESYYRATVVQVNLKYTGTSIYMYIFILFVSLLMLPVVSLDVDGAVSYEQWEASEEKVRM